MSRTKINVIVKIPHLKRLNDVLLFTSRLNVHNEFNFIYLLTNNAIYDEAASRIRTQSFNIKRFYETTQNTEKKIEKKKSSNHLKNNLIYLFHNLSFMKKPLKWIINKIMGMTLIQLLSSRSLYNRFIQDYYISNKIIKENEPSLVIVLSDRSWLINPSFIKKCNDNNIKTIMPYLTYSSADGPKKSREGSNIYKKHFLSSLYSHYVFYKYPQQVYKGYLFYKPYIITALDKFGALPKNPWIPGNGFVDIVCVDNHHTLHRYISGGASEEKLCITGDLAYDELFESYQNKDTKREEFIKRYNLSIDKKIIIISLPQLAEHGLMDWEQHWNEIHFLMKNVCELKQNVLVSLHPKMNRDNYIFLEDEYKCKIIHERLFDSLPIADLFIATFSSTIVWAVLCGIKSIVVDFYDFNYSMYDFLTTPNIIREKQIYQETILQALADEPDFTDDWKSLSRDETFDGNVMERYRKLLINQSGQD